jgi:hypothetical protein
MKRTWLIPLAVLCALSLQTHEAASSSLTVPVTSSALSTYLSETQPAYVLSVSIPDEISGKRLDTALLEFYVDAALLESADIDHSPSIDVRALSAAYSGTGEPQFSVESGGASRPVQVGEQRRVVVDITSIVKGWIESPQSNHGLVIGSLRGSKAGDFSVRNDVLGGGNVATVTFFYQNRFGQRISSVQH